MLTRIGRTPAQGDVVDALVDCHQRIRDFTALALRLATTPGLSEDEIKDAAARVHRYFSLALPLHAQDEEESLRPRLEGLDPEVDAEMAEMLREHAEHVLPTDRLLATCAQLQQQPDELPRLAEGLAATARELERHFQAHLAREERVIFPAIRARLDLDTQRQIQAEMKQRRGS